MTGWLDEIDITFIRLVMSVVLTQTSVGAEHMAAVTWASILDLLRMISLIFCTTVGITNRSILRHN